MYNTKPTIRTDLFLPKMMSMAHTANKILTIRYSICTLPTQYFVICNHGPLIAGARWLLTVVTKRMLNAEAARRVDVA